MAVAGAFFLVRTYLCLPVNEAKLVLDGATAPEGAVETMNTERKERRQKMEEQEGTIAIPDAVKNILRPDEQVVAAVRQSRLKAVITPDSIVVTDQRIIRYSPSAFGLRKTIEDYRYEDMANFKVKKGIMFATITLRQRFMSDDLVLDNLPKDKMDIISKVVNEGILRAKSGAIPQALTPQPVSGPQSEDPLKLLKLRLAKGEITKEEYEDLKQLLE